ncbi:Uncharacterised protein [Alysiella crassa]|uniref:Uncharacterized protein n=1 Tax=Alysiella crassa TaxID=153491 RepID=A0A376BLZ6_9NEIS|nr:Uncharacterised protein [Alysiella crassa]
MYIHKPRFIFPFCVHCFLLGNHEFFTPQIADFRLPFGKNIFI